MNLNTIIGKKKQVKNEAIITNTSYQPVPVPVKRGNIPTRCKGSRF